MAETTYYAAATRFLRQYRAPTLTATYASLTAAVEADSRLPAQPWGYVPTYRSAVFPPHAEILTPTADRDYYDAYLTCAEHADGLHRVYAGMAAYRIAVPAAFVGQTLTSLSVNVSCDPYNPYGARVALGTSPAAVTQPATTDEAVREGDAHADGVAPRTSSFSTPLYWYGATAAATLTPAGGLVLGAYVWVYLSLENYARARNGWVEGAAKIAPLFTLVMADAVAGHTAGSHIGGGYTDPSMTLAAAGVASEPTKVGNINASTWPTKQVMYQEVYGAFRPAATSTKLPSLARQVVAGSAGNPGFDTVFSWDTPSIFEAFGPILNTVTWSSTQYGLAANVQYATLGQYYVFYTASVYMLPYTQIPGFAASAIVLTNGATALDFKGCLVQITPWFVEAPSALTSAQTTVCFVLQALTKNAGFWTGTATTTTGTVTDASETPVSYEVTATRLGPPMYMPDTLAGTASLQIALSISPTKPGMIILVPHIVDPGTRFATGTAVVGLGSLRFAAIFNQAGNGVSGAGWLPAVTLV